MRIFRNSRGETLAETIIALSVLAIGITIASTVIINSIRNLTNAKSRVTAINIAREGIEAVRNIRDTNWLYYSDRRRQCWNHNPSEGACDGAHPIIPGVYIVYKDTDHRWKLYPADPDFDNDDSDSDLIDNNDVDPSLTLLSLVDIDLGLDSNNNTDNEDDLDMYNPDPAIIPAPFPGALGKFVRTTPFSRYITIEYLENVPGGDSTVDDPPDAVNSKSEWDGADQPTLNRMRITSTVEWTRRATHAAELTTIITDHLGRENLTN